MTRRLLDAFWRATAYCLHPKVIALSLAPLVIVGGAAALLGYFFWEPAVASVRATLEDWTLLAVLFSWLDTIGATGFRSVIAPLVIVALAVPVFVVASLVVVAWLMTPALVRLIAARRFPSLERREGGGLWQSLVWSLACTLAALLALVVSIPLWFIPPLVLVLPPVIWGWLTYRVFAFDVLALHATREERRRLIAEHRWPLFGMGIACGYLGAAPSLLWAAGAITLVFAPLLIVVSIWLYTLVFAFSALWFAHYLLAALRDLRSAEVPRRPATGRAARAVRGAAVVPRNAERNRDMNFGLIIIGDEILSGKRVDKHLPKVIELLAARGLALSWARCVGDDPARITADLRDAFASGDVVFSCGGIGATPDDHTRQCAAAALGVPLALHPEAKEFVLERMRETAREQGKPYEPERDDNQHRLNMAVFPEGAAVIPNPYNKIAGFSIRRGEGGVFFVPGFPVMAWPMIEWVLDTSTPSCSRAANARAFGHRLRCDGGGVDAADGSDRAGFAGVKVFSLPSVDHEQCGRHIELGVKGQEPGSTRRTQR